MASFRYVVCDVFTAVPLTGNPVAVFTDARELPEERLQSLARELNLSETVFVYPPDGDGHVRVRIFTPATELPFAGHPVLGTAFVLGGPLQLAEIRLETEAGTVPVRLEREGARIAFGWMTQPVPNWEPAAPEQAADLVAALGVRESELPVALYHQGPGHWFVTLASGDEVAVLRPDLTALGALTLHGVACVAPDGERWRLRDFLPAIGIPEDPATGSAAGPLALHLARNRRIEWGDEIEIHQGAEVGRPSTLFAVAHSEERIEVGGPAVVVARGEFRL
jgi:trans-2,3-dihydro-3-hydroxyanthranilate isomerase